jgi:oligopeptide transport system substrate-binding protein
MKIKLFVILSMCAVLFGCGSGNDGKVEDNDLVEGKGGRYTGGFFVVNEPEYIKNLFPHSIIDAPSYRVASQVYEGLMKFSQDSLNLIKCLGESYEVDSSYTKYTFHLKKGVLFHDNECFADGKGREMTSEDVKYCFTLLCTPSANNQGFSMFQDILKGATEYYNAAKDGNKPGTDIEGIKVIDKYTVEFTLVKPNSMFLFNLARPFTFIFPKEAYEKHGLEMRTKAVGTGPFVLDKIDENLAILLKKNANYHGTDEFGNKLPYLSGIKVRFIRDKKSEYLEYKKGNLDMVYHLPTDYMIEIKEEAVKKKVEYGELQQTPEMAVNFLSFSNTHKLFSNVNFRKAISFAVDRKKILEAVLNGEGYAPGFYGITPIDIFPGYNAKDIKGYTMNVDSAKYYLQKAGFTNGKTLPKITLELNSDGERNVNVAQEVKKQLKDNINLDIELNVVTTAQLAENLISGKASFFRVGWGADYPSPENFLWYLYGKNVPTDTTKSSYPNMARYRNAKFDEYYEKGLGAQDKKTQYENFLKAEQIAMNDAPIVVLWYDEGYRLIQNKVKNFPNNAMQYRDFGNVYFVPQEASTGE